jgi:transcriptional regulator with XRE-family HTH domain
LRLLTSQEAKLLNPAAMAMARRGRGLTQDELARLIGCPVRTVESWEKGERNPSPENLRRLVRALRVTEQDLTPEPQPVSAA